MPSRPTFSWSCCARRPRWRVRRAPAARGLARLARGLARRTAVVADLVVLEIAGKLGGVLLLEQPLEPAPRRIPGFLAAALGEVQVLDDLVEVDVAVLNDRLVG